MSSVADDSNASKVVRTCARHGKKRQTIFLVSGENEDEWNCRDEDQCKLTQTNSKVKGPKSGATSVDPAVRSSSVSLTPETNSADHQQIACGLISFPSVTSWADEVDEEFPEELLSPDDCRYTFLGQHQRSNTQEHWPARAAQPKQSAPSRWIPNFTSKMRRSSGAGSPLRPNDKELLSRIDQLQEELAATKRELKDAREELKMVAQDERQLESIVDDLRAEVAQIRKKQLQLALPCLDHHPKPALAGKLNPAATPFVPVTQCCLGSGSKGPEAAPRGAAGGHVDSARSTVTKDSARSEQTSALSALELESYDSESFGRSGRYEDGQDVGVDYGSGSEHEDDSPRFLQPSQLSRARSEDMYRPSVGILS